MKLMFWYSPEATRFDHLAPGYLGINDGFPASPSIVDHQDEILHRAPVLGKIAPPNIPKIGTMSRKF